MKKIGIPNLGNTCYSNSILQILSSIMCLTIPAQLDAREGIEKDKYTMAANIYSLIKEIRKGEVQKSTLVKTYLSVAKCYPSFRLGQQDQNEYLNTILTVLHDCTAKPSVMNIVMPDRPLNQEEQLELRAYHSMRIDGSSVIGTSDVTLTNNIFMRSSISENFTGQILTQTLCTNCGHVSCMFDVFRTWELPIPKPKSGTISLGDCIDVFTQRTQLSQKEQNKCTHCNVYNPSHIIRCLWHAPKILIISLGRFINTWDGKSEMLMTKNGSLVDLPEDLILNVRDHHINYTLVSIAHHIGGLNSGHCYAQVKDNEGKWYLIDDETVNQVDHFTSDNAYIVFYARA
jgi:ubiquitin carboxyl-terminal hydrolase 8